MKNRRRCFTAIALSFFCFSVFHMPFEYHIGASAMDMKYENITYTIDGEHAVVTGCEEGSESVTIPEKIEGCDVTEIRELAFANCTALKHVELPEHLSAIGNRAFMNCKSLQSIDLPDLTEIEHNTFNGCNSLTEVVIPDTVQSVGNGAFRNCEELASVTFRGSLKEMKKTVFENTAWLENQSDGFVYISNVLYCYKGTMPENTKLKLDQAITVIADCALLGQKNLTQIAFHKNVSMIGWGAFQDTGLISADIPSVSAIQTDTFKNCRSLKRVTIPGTVKTIASSAFGKCDKLEQVTLGHGIETIDISAFVNCISLKSVAIPASVKTIRTDAFGYRSIDDNLDDDIELKPMRNFTIYGYTGTAAESYANANGFRFEVQQDPPPTTVRGDVNNDGVFGVSDAVLLQKWLLTIPDTQLDNWQAADFHEDGNLNAIDFSLMTYELI